MDTHLGWHFSNTGIAAGKSMQLKVRRLNTNAKLPTYANEGDACFDLYAAEGCSIRPGTAASISTGISLQPPEQHRIRIITKGTRNLRLVNATRLLEPGNQDVVQVRLHNDGPSTYVVRPGDLIAGAVLVALPEVQLIEV